MEQYLKLLLEQIRCKRVHPYIKEEIAHLLQQMNQAAEEMDIDALDCLWTELSSYDFAEDKQETLEKIQKAILAFDVDYLQGVTHL